jgi:hypothetical protein
VRLVGKTETVKQVQQINYTAILKPLPVCLSTYRRWRARIARGEDPVQKPGPKVVNPLDLNRLNAELEQLIHTTKRSRGIGKARAALKDFISRRELSDMAEQLRKEHVRHTRGSQRKLYWRVPGSVWGMDTCETRMDNLPGKQFILCVTDLASGYKFAPLVTTTEPCGPHVSAHLEKLFEQFGRPLFLKRDNGANLNHGAIADLLSHNHILPLNSPCYYAPYNGAIERGQGEIKWKLKREHDDVRTFGEFARGIGLIVHDLNHLARRKLDGSTSCIRFFERPRVNYSKRKRMEVMLWISERAFDIVEKAGGDMTPDAAYRIACQIWLVKNDLLSVSKHGGVLPHLSGKTAHN